MIEFLISHFGIMEGTFKNLKTGILGENGEEQKNHQ